MSLFDLARTNNSAGFRARLTTLPPTDAVRELLHRGDGTSGLTPLLFVFLFVVDHASSLVELLGDICDVMKADHKKTNLFAIVSDFGNYPLHWCAAHTKSVEVLQFVIDKFPNAIEYENANKHTPLSLARQQNALLPIIRCLEVNTCKYLSSRNQVTFKCCMIKWKRQGMTEYVSRTPVNDLTQLQFVFLLLDNMVNCEMKLMAEDIISFIG